MKRIAIIGTGISGLAVAWQLRGFDCEITFYEKQDRLGGNCRTGWVSIGGEYRFCDLGVNDFNTRAYTSVVKVMDEVGIPYGLLEDSACFYSFDGPLYQQKKWECDDGKWVEKTLDRVAYTIGGLDYLPMPAELAAEFARFQIEAPDFLKDPNNRKKLATLTIGQYLDLGKYSKRFARTCILPRVNAMYFMTDDPDSTAADMPFKAVMHYYMLQEGFGTHFDGPLRMYFHEGAANWLERLAQYLKADIVFGADVQVDWDRGSERWGIWDRASPAGAPRALVDTVVFACHADEVLKVFRNWSGPPWNAIAPILKKFRYAPSTAIAHTYAGLLPQDPNLWRTYNVYVHEPQGPAPKWHPYSMTYLCNKHQNDSASGRYDRYGGPQYFVTLNPQRQIPEESLLLDANTGSPVTGSFPHNVLDFAALDAQERLLPYQGSGQENGTPVYFTGGWCYHAGLHEECWVYSSAVAEAIRTGKFVAPPFYDEGGAPAHILNVSAPGRTRAA